MKTLVKRSVSLSGHRTSIALEPEFWTVLEAMATMQARSLPGLIATIDDARAPGRPLTSALRVAALEHARASRPPGPTAPGRD